MNNRIELEAIRDQVNVLVNDVQDALDDEKTANQFNKGMAMAYFIVGQLLDIRIEKVSLTLEPKQRKLSFDIVGQP